MVEVYLPKTDERQFLRWLHTYRAQKSESERVYEFLKGWIYKLYYPDLEDENSASFTARIYRAFRREEGNETTETMATNLPAIKLEWHRVEDGLKVTISHHDGLWVTPPLNDLLTSIRTNWPDAVSDNWT
jgi:hypothetical protein